MTCQWQYQVRFDVNDSATAESVRRQHRGPTLARLFDILAKRGAALKCQFDAFAEYVAAAEEHGVENYPLYYWTKATIENPAKKEKYLKSFTLHVDDREVYAKEIADALRRTCNRSPRASLSRDYPNTILIPPTIPSRKVTCALHASRTKRCGMSALASLVRERVDIERV